ncbi:hypothetical protein [Actinoplanes teichomyceticus]|uniref:Copper(I)-binding protein n=1 Tax=Actinoplanes teichomyceticus TaxID=1867 RepID=A0A561WQH1_ACTTI|nr:hypothetical protein [Actinoplanes teichomyceticus]TWG26105.1 hypothetical protein FHX34_1011082 [Actinoplanes teichomyceticus]GIF11180.1 hypothetical protein Ate01nite_12120 [Actinoplanes teichomyceticus]
MRSLGTRRAALVAGAATVAVIALAGCSAGQVAETAMLDTPIVGVDANSADDSVFVRDATVQYNGLEGYAKDANAPLQLSLYNQTTTELTVTISSRPTDQPQVVSARQVGTVGAAAPVTGNQPSAANATEIPGEEPPSASPSQPATAPQPGVSVQPGAAEQPASAPAAAQVTPANIKIAPLGSALFRPTDRQPLQVIGLSDALKPGMSVNLVLQFSNGSAPLEIQVPVAIPLSPASRAPGNEGEDIESE